MRTTVKCLTLMTVVLLLVGSASAQQQFDVYKAGVPDVDKNPANPNQPLAGDMSCWQASAANLLGGAGWGLAANTAQQNATAIYGHMTAHFGTANPGDPALAANWWLYNYGYNSNEAANGWYRPSLTYNDVTAIYRNLTNADYDFLLAELQRCQYVGVSWEFSDSEIGWNHALTLVGGNWSNIHVPAGNPLQSIWHDSDADVGNGPDGVNDDVYNNAFPGGFWRLPGYAPISSAQGYVTVCPGVQKPDSAMSNYDVAWHKDQALNGVVSNVWRIAGSANFGAPGWVQDGNDDWTILQIENEEIPEKWKEVYLLVDFRDRLYGGANALTPPDIQVVDDDGKLYDQPVVTVSADGGQILYHWTLDDQPAFEHIIFPNEDYYYLTSDVKDFNIATECVPEPMTVGLLVLGGLALLRRRR